MNEGDMSLASLPQQDGIHKDRPVLLLKRFPPFGDFLVCGVSTQLYRLAPELDELISPGDSDYASSRWKAPSLIRLGHLTVLSTSQLKGCIGRVSKWRQTRLLSRLTHELVPNEAEPTSVQLDLWCGGG
jgi:mRNA interferase MazF